MDYMIRSKIIIIDGLKVRVVRRGFALLFRLYYLSIEIKNLSETDIIGEVFDTIKDLKLTEKQIKKLIQIKNNDIREAIKLKVRDRVKLLIEFVDKKYKRKIRRYNTADLQELERQIVKFNTPDIKSLDDSGDTMDTLKQVNREFAIALNDACRLTNTPPWEAVRLTNMELYYLRIGDNYHRANMIIDNNAGYNGNNDHIGNLRNTTHETISTIDLIERMQEKKKQEEEEEKGASNGR